MLMLRVGKAQGGNVVTTILKPLWTLLYEVYLDKYTDLHILYCAIRPHLVEYHEL